MGRSREEAIRVHKPRGKRRLKSVLKRIVYEMNERNKIVTVGLYLLGDFLQDGVIDGSLITGIFS